MELDVNFSNAGTLDGLNHTGLHGETIVFLLQGVCLMSAHTHAHTHGRFRKYLLTDIQASDNANSGGDNSKHNLLGRINN